MPQLLRYDWDPREGGVPALEGIFLGWLPGGGQPSAMLLGSLEDSVAILGPPRVGKTSGVLIPQALLWPGSLISASTKPDVLRATRRRRLELAVLGDGDVYVYSPTDPRDVIDGVRAIHWSPAAGCEDPATCEVRVQKMLGPEKPTEQVFFRQAGATVMRGFFHAAAIAGCTMTQVKRWIDTMDVEDAVSILYAHAPGSAAAAAYASGLEGIAKQAPETKAGTFGTVSEKLAAIVGNASALANADRHDFDVDAFLRTGSTLYVVAPEDVQAVIAPLVAGLVESLVSRAYQLAQSTHTGRMDPPLLLLLDEVGAIAPLQSLPQIMSQGASQGVLCVWAAQSFNQLKARWGEDWANSIWGASSHKLIFGGLGDADLLERISQSFGDWDRRVNPHANPIGILAAALNRQVVTPQVVQTRKVKVDELHGMPPGTATVIAATPAGPSKQELATPPAALVQPFARYAGAPPADASEPPDVARARARMDAAFATLPAAQQRAYHDAAQALHRRLGDVTQADHSRRQQLLSKEPALAREVRGYEHFLQQPPHVQAYIQTTLIQRFAAGMSVSYAHLVSAEPSPEPGSRPTPPPTARVDPPRRTPARGVPDPNRYAPRAPDVYKKRGPKP